MTKKDYVALAAAIRNMPVLVDTDAWVKTSDIISAIADVLAADNSSFDRDRFVAAARGTMKVPTVRQLNAISKRAKSCPSITVTIWRTTKITCAAVARRTASGSWWQRNFLRT